MPAPAESSTPSAAGPARRRTLTMVQLLLLVALCGLLFGLFLAARNAADLRGARLLDVSPGGKLVAIELRGRVEVWEIAGRSGRRVFMRPRSGAGLLKFANDTTLVTLDDAHTLTLFDMRTGAERLSRTFDFVVSDCDVSADLRRVLVVNLSDAAVELWSLTAGERLHRFPGAVDEVRFVRDDSACVTFSRDSTRLYDLPTRQPIWITGAADPPYDISADGRWLADVDLHEPHKVRVFDVLDGTRDLLTHADAAGLAALRFSPDASHLLLVYRDRFRWWNLETTDTLRQHLWSNTAVATSRDGSTVVGLLREIVTWHRTNDLQFQGRLRLRNSARSAAGYFLGFVLWAFAWSRVTRVPPTWVPPDTSLRMRRVRHTHVLDNDAHRWRRLVQRSLSGMAALAAAIAYFFRVEILTSLMLAFVLVPVLVASATIVPRWFARRISGSFSVDLWWAQWHAGKGGRRRKVGRLLAWFEGPSWIEPVLADEVEDARRELSSLLGREVRFHRPGLLLCFADHVHLETFLQHTTPGPAEFLEGGRRAVLCEPSSLGLLQTPAETLRRALAYYGLSCCVPRPEPWVVAVLGAWLAWRDADAERSGAHRRLRCAEARNEFSAASFFEMSAADLVHGCSESTGYARNTHLADLATSLAGYYLGTDAPPERRQRFLAFLRALPTVSATTARDEHLGALDRLLADWQAWRAEQPTDIWAAPPQELRATIAQYVLPVLRHATDDEDEAARVARQLAASGIANATEALRDTLDAASERLARVVRRSLEALTGQCSHHAPRDEPRAIDADSRQAHLAERDGYVTWDDERWRTWLGSLPPGCRTTTTAPAPTFYSDERSEQLPTAARSLCWVLMRWGGGLAVALAMFHAFANGAYWFPPLHLALAAGLGMMVQGFRRSVGWMRTLAWLQLACVLMCSVPNFFAGLVILALLVQEEELALSNAPLAK